MKRCPNCKWESAKPNNYCEKCLHDLRYDIGGGREVHLVTVYSEEEALVLEGLLKSEGIHFYRRNDRVGDFLKATTGNIEIGLNIFVSEKDHELARDLINSEPVPLDELDFQNEEVTEGHKAEELADQCLEKETTISNTTTIVLMVMIIFALYFIMKLNG